MPAYIDKELLRQNTKQVQSYPRGQYAKTVRDFNDALEEQSNIVKSLTSQ